MDSHCQMAVPQAAGTSWHGGFDSGFPLSTGRTPGGEYVHLTVVSKPQFLGFPPKQAMEALTMDSHCKMAVPQAAGTSI